MAFQLNVNAPKGLSSNQLRHPTPPSRFDPSDPLNYKTYQDFINAGQAQYAPDLAGLFGKTEKDLADYQAGLENIDYMARGEGIDSAAGLSAVGAYDPSQLSYMMPDGTVKDLPYKSTEFNAFSGTTDPVTGKQVGGYQAPEEYQAFQYQTPEIADIQNVQGMSDALWDTQAAGQREKIGQQFADTEAKMKQAAIQTQARPEQMAALLANQGIEQSKAQTAAQNALDVQRAQQNIGLASTMQALQAQRGTQQAQLEAANQEAQAQELAKKYGLDVDAARYIVAQKTEEQTAQQGEERFKTGLEQQKRETEQSERQKAYESQYGLAQDVAQAKMADWQAKNAAALDAANARLQGQQAASQNAAQQATYQSNMTPEGRAAEQQNKGKYTTAWQQSNKDNAAKQQATSSARSGATPMPTSGSSISINKAAANTALPARRA